MTCIQFFRGENNCWEIVGNWGNVTRNNSRAGELFGEIGWTLLGMNGLEQFARGGIIWGNRVNVTRNEWP